jgi:hypothetical protein
VSECLAPHGLEDRWTYRAGGDIRGLQPDVVRHLCEEASALIVVGDPFDRWRPEYESVRLRVFVDVDPGFTQLRLLKGDRSLKETVAHCDCLFTIGQGIGTADCPIPNTGRRWISTLPPVSLPHWPVVSAAADAPFTAIMDWQYLLGLEQLGFDVY